MLSRTRKKTHSLIVKKYTNFKENLAKYIPCLMKKFKGLPLKRTGCFQFREPLIIQYNKNFATKPQERTLKLIKQKNTYGAKSVNKSQEIQRLKTQGMKMKKNKKALKEVRNNSQTILFKPRVPVGISKNYLSMFFPKYKFIAERFSTVNLKSDSGHNSYKRPQTVNALPLKKFRNLILQGKEVVEASVFPLVQVYK